MSVRFLHEITLLLLYQHLGNNFDCCFGVFWSEIFYKKAFQKKTGKKYLIQKNYNR